MPVRTKYTIIPASLWQWWPLMSCSATARTVWFALYTSMEAKRFPPGLWHGSLRVLAEAAHLPDADTEAGVLELMAARLIERDPKTQVIRMSEWPPEVDHPANGSTIKGWWGRFRDVPACGLRDRHVACLHSLILPKADQERAWAETFGLLMAVVVTPGPTLQLEMFGSETHRSDAPSRSESRPQVGSEDLNSNRKEPDHPPTHPHPLWIMDQGSGSSSSEGESEREVRPVPPTTVPVAELVGARAVPEAGTPVAPPALHTTTPGGLLELLATHSGGRVGRTVDPRLSKAVRDTIDACSDAGVVVADLERVGRWIAAGALAYRQELGARWVGTPGALLEAVEQARRWEAPAPAKATGRNLPPIAMPVAPPRRASPVGYVRPPTYGAEHFQGGRRQL